MNKTYTVVLIDDHELVRAGIRALLDSIDSITVIGESGQGVDAIKEIRKLEPDLVLLDISLKGMNGVELIDVIKQQKLTSKILMLTMHNNIEYIAKSLRKGASGYLLKDSAVDELEPAIMQVLKGRRYISKEIDQDLLKQFMLQEASSDSLLDLLTSRQRQILQLIAEGCSTRDIAEMINVSIKTVETHRSHIMSRLNIFDIAGLVRFAVKENLVS